MENQSITIKKTLLNATLNANLDTLRVFLPDVYEGFKDYIPQDSGVIIDDDGNVDLFNNDNAVYSGQAESFSKEQVNNFLKEPRTFTQSLNKIDEASILYDHQRTLKNIIDKRELETSTSVGIIEERFDFVVMLGAGLGYQIVELFKLKTIKHFLLCEPSKDVFFAMLHCIELRPLFEGNAKNGGSINFIIGSNDTEALNAIDGVLTRNGRFYLANFYIYEHYQSDMNNASIEMLKKLGYRLGFGWGFMEDEVIGFNHTLANLKLGHKVLKKQSEFINNKPDYPVFIVANGPSLDFSLDFLRANQDKIIIVSCGTTLRSLLKNNIKPDIHVEMERPVEMLPIIEEVEQQQVNSAIKLKDIQIIALNTVYPELLKKFKSPLIFPKYNDAGEEFINALDTFNVHSAPEHSNPTCPNAAMTLIISLGFTKVYLMGTDFGYINREKHHSKDSFYYDKKYRDKTPNGDGIDANMTDDISRKGNFRDSVFTNDIFDSSRLGIEMLLAMKPEVSVFNCSDGALIDKAQPLLIKDIFLADIDNSSKETFLTSLLDSAFENNSFTVDKIANYIQGSSKLLKVILEQLVLITDKKVKSREELADLFFEQHQLLMELSEREEYKFYYKLIQGTFKYLQTSIMSNCFHYSDLNKRVEFINFCLKEFNQHIKYLFREYEITFVDA